MRNKSIRKIIVFSQIFFANILIISILTLLLGTPPLYANSRRRIIKINGKRAARGEVIVKYKNNAESSNSIKSLKNKHKVSTKKQKRLFKTKFHKLKRNNKLSNIHKLTFAEDQNPQTVANDFKNDPNVIYAEPNYLHEICATPNDTDFNKQWYLQNNGYDISATKAWDIQNGSPSTIIAVIDTGVDYNHSDLKQNIWINANEIAGNGIDDDNNGFIDDYYGWDFSDNDNNPSDYHNHGTHIAGIIGAVSNNNSGIAGINWNSKIMSVKIFPEAYSDVCAEAIRYAADNGAKIINISWGSSSESQTVKEAIDYATSLGAVVVCAAGNNNSQEAYYPAYHENTIAVTATDNSDKKASFSNYGSWIDISAPGKNIYSAYLNNSYGEMDGTSMAAPVVSGVAGLIISNNSSLSASEIRNLIINTSDKIDFLNPNYPNQLGSGRINAYAALQNSNDITPPTGILSAPTDEGDYSNTASINFSWTETISDPESDIKGYYLQAGTTPGGNDKFDGFIGNTLSETIADCVDGQTYYARIRGYNNAGLSTAWSPSSNGITIRLQNDITPPVFSGIVRDGTNPAYDDDVIYSNLILSANWDEASDTESGISKYWYAIGTTPGSGNVLDWTDIGLNNKIANDSLNLTYNTTYYISVYAENNSGLKSNILTSDGLSCEEFLFGFGAKPVTPEEQKMIIENASDTVIEPNELALARYNENPGSKYGLAAGPKNYHYLPAVGNQGSQSSCVSWATGYYFKTYQEAQERGWTRTHSSFPSIIRSPAFLYNLNNNGVDNGSSIPNNFATLMHHGCASLSEMPYSLTGYTNFPSESAFQNALNYRNEVVNWSVATMDISTEDGITALKQHLSNGNLAVFSFNVYNNFKNMYPNGSGIYNEVYYENAAGAVTDTDGDQVSHAMTIIGYDEDKTYPGGTGGAFLIVNSWGSNWGAYDSDIGTKGFVWMSKDYMKNFVQTAYYVPDKTGYSPTAYGYVSVNHISISDITSYSFMKGSDYTSPESQIDFTTLRFCGALPVNQRITFDLTELNIEDYKKYWLRITDNGTANEGEITSFSIERVGDVRVYSNDTDDGPVETVNGLSVYLDLNYKTDSSPPDPIATVNDGTGEDITWALDAIPLRANWTATDDPDTGVAKYWYAIGTTPGGTDTVDWTDNGTSLSASDSSVVFSNGQTYYFSVRAENGSGVQSTPTNSNGQTVDIDSPDIDSLTSSTHANENTWYNNSLPSYSWSGSDDESGIQGYYYVLSQNQNASPYSGTFTTSASYSYISPQADGIWYFRIVAQDNAGQYSLIHTHTTRIDTTAPSTISSVNDGLSTDIQYTTSSSELSANWTSSTDSGSDLARYEFAIGTSQGATDVTGGWINNNLNTSVTYSTPGTSNGQTYYFSVRAVDNSGLISTPTNSDGQTVDLDDPQIDTLTSSSHPDENTWYSENTPSYSWTGSDNGSGIKGYHCFIDQVANYTPNEIKAIGGFSTNANYTGLTTLNDGIWYFHLVAEDNADRLSAALSLATRIDTSAPVTISNVNDGTSTDIEYTTSITELSANWTSSTDSGSGIARYEYAIGTSQGATDVTNGWINNNLNTSVTHPTSGISNGQTYYFSVRVIDNAGFYSSPTNSDGVTVDIDTPQINSLSSSSHADENTWYNASFPDYSWSGSDNGSGIKGYYYLLDQITSHTPNEIRSAGAFTTDTNHICYIQKDDGIWYFHLVAEDNSDKLSVVSRHTTRVDTSAPITISSVNDGISSDIEYTTSTTELSANWTATTDPQTNITRYEYAIGTTQGATDVTGGWINNSLNTSVTHSASLSHGITYYFSVRAINGIGLISTPRNSNGQTVNTNNTQINSLTSSSHPDENTWYNDNTPSYSWTGSDITGYYCLLDQNASHTANEVHSLGAYTTLTSFDSIGSRTSGVWYFHIVGEDDLGLLTTVTTHITRIDTSAPLAVPQINDGTFTLSDTELSATWQAAIDNESGIAYYEYAIGTTQGGTDIVNWTNIGNNTAVTATGFGTLEHNTMYYFSVKATNNINLESLVTFSDGVRTELTPPPAVTNINDGPGSDVDWINLNNTLSANWSESIDPETGVIRYWYAIGTTPGAIDITQGWINNGNTRSTEFTTASSLADGTTCYFSVRAENTPGMLSEITTSDGQTIDTGNPEPIAVINDGTGSDIYWTSSLTQLSANWTPAESISPVINYWYAIGTTQGGIDVTGAWINNGTNLSVTHNSLNLQNGFTYYFSVKAENIFGKQSIISYSNGVRIDNTAPEAISSVRDGLTNTDIDWTGPTTQLSANWSASADTESNILRYWYAIGTAPGATDITQGWINNGINLGVIRPGLTLETGETYFFSVRSENYAGLLSQISSSDGITLDDSVPTETTLVNDGTSNDIDWAACTSQLSANWPASYSASGILRYWYSIGTSPSSTDVVHWTDNGNNLNVTHQGLSLEHGKTYYFSVQAENNLEQFSAINCSDGITIDCKAPTANISLSNTLPLATGEQIVTLTIEEDNTISGTPTLSYILSNGKKYALELSGSGKTWTGKFFIESTTPEGLAKFEFSAQDFLGNSGASILQGENFTIKTTLNAGESSLVHNSDGTSAKIISNTFNEQVQIRISIPRTLPDIVETANMKISKQRKISIINNSNLYREFIALDIWGNEITAFDTPITISIPYDDDNNDGFLDGTTINEDYLQLFYLNEETETWMPVAGSITDKDNNVVSANVSHFSIFAIMALYAPNYISQAIAYPNPCYFNRTSNLQIDNIPLNASNVRIYIYNIAGELVKTLTENSGIQTQVNTKVARWNGKDDNEEKVASGIYICLIKSNGNTRTEKVAVFW